MRGVIILDGADGVGKTTLAENLVKRCEELGSKAVIHHLGKPDKGTCWDIHSKALMAYIKEAFEQDTVVIADRHFLSESIYGAIYREGSEYPYASRHVDRLLHRFRGLRVVCAPSVEYVQQTFKRLMEERYEMYSENMEKIAQAYHEVWHGGQLMSHMKEGYTPDYVAQLSLSGGVKDMLGWYHYDVQLHGKDMKTYCSYLLNELIEEQELVPESLYNIDYWRFTGYPHEQAVLLVGDKVSADNELHVPFFANNGCTDYLAQTLQNLWVDESRVVMANINDPHGDSTVRELSQMCGHTVAMGREAERGLQRLGIAYDGRVRHPQHARRFSHNDHSYHHELGHTINGWAGVNYGS